MIIGDPYKFAIIIELVPNWSNNTFLNGVVLFSINGKILFGDIRTSTLGCDVFEFIDNIKRVENNLPVNTDIYRMEKSSAFIQMFNIAYPSDYDIPNDFTYLISTTQLGDDEYFMFAVADHNKIRILGGSLDTYSMKCNEIIEVFISKRYLSYFLRSLLRFKMDNVSLKWEESNNYQISGRLKKSRKNSNQ